MQCSGRDINEKKLRPNFPPTPLQSLTEMVTQGHPSPSARAGEGTGCVVDIDIALQEVLKINLIQEGLAQGIHEASEVLDQRSTHLCVPAFNYEEPLGMQSICDGGPLC